MQAFVALNLQLIQVMTYSRRNRLLPLTLIAAGGLLCHTFVGPGYTPRRPECKSTDGRTVDCAVDSSETTVLPLAFALPAIASVALLLSVQPAHAFLPEEEQQGYIQNFLGYANLTINFILGFFGMVFGPVIRQFQKPGPQKYFIAFGGIGAIVFLGWTVKEMIAV